MDEKQAAIEIVDLISEYSFNDSLCSLEISNRAGSYDKLNKIRENSKIAILNIFPELKFDKNNLIKFGLPKKFNQTVHAKIEGLSIEEIDTFLKALKEDVKQVKRLYKELIKL